MYLLWHALYLVFSIIILCVFSCTSYRISYLFKFRCSFIVFFRFIVFNKSHNSYSLIVYTFFFYVNYLSSLQLQTTLLSIYYHLLRHDSFSKNIYPPPPRLLKPYIFSLYYTCPSILLFGTSYIYLFYVIYQTLF